MRDGSSRTADKINVRLPDGVRQRIAEICQAEHIAMNTYVVQALEEKLARDAEWPQVLARINEQLTAIAARLGITPDDRLAGDRQPTLDEDAPQI